MANNKKFDVIVVGGGPAGLNIAGVLAQKEVRVCLIDNKADLASISFHTLGSFLNPSRHGLSDRIIASRISEVGFHSKRVNAIKKGSAFILNKSQIHRELLERAVLRNVFLKTETSIRDLHQNNDGAVGCVMDASGNSYESKIFVDATGVSGFFSKKFGLQDEKSRVAVGLEYNARYVGPQERAHLFIGHDFEGGYGWIFPIGKGRAILGYGVIGLGGQINSKEKLDRICLLPSVRSLVEKDNERLSGGTIPITDVKTNFVYKNVICVGDSVSQVHPLVGEGYRFIFESGKIAALFILEALKTGNISRLSEYEKEWRRIFYSSYRRGKLCQKIMHAASKSDLGSDIITLIIKSISDHRFQRLISGGI